VGRIHWLPTQCHSWVCGCPPCPLCSRAPEFDNNRLWNEKAL